MDSKDKNREREFSEYLDRLLAGEDAVFPEDMNDDMRSALEFARELAAQRSVPSPEFSTALKRDLLHRLTEMELEAQQNEKKRRFSGGMLGRTLATAVIVIALAAVGVFWFMGGFPAFHEPEPLPSPTPTSSPSPTMEPTTAPQPTAVPEPTAAPEPMPEPEPTTAPSPTQLPARYIEMAGEFDKETYLPGEPVTVEVSFTNITTKPFTITPFPPEIEVRSAGVHHDDVVYRFPAGDTLVKLQPGETATYPLTWDQRDGQGYQVPYGQYLFLVPSGGTLEDGRLLESIYILPAEGVIEKTFEVNESRTTGGVTITLKRTELTRSGPHFIAFNTDYRAPEPPPSMETVTAEYSIDGGPVRETGSVIAVSGGSEVDGYDYVWFMSIPVPSGTKELTFTITRFGDNDGPWEFTVPLE